MTENLAGMSSLKKTVKKSETAEAPDPDQLTRRTRSACDWADNSSVASTSGHEDTSEKWKRRPA